MKLFLNSLLLSLICLQGFSRAFYFSATGNDSRTVTEATNSGTPWKSIAKANALFAGTAGITLAAGDSVLFKGGDSFYGALLIKKSGAAGKNIYVGSYGTGMATLTGMHQFTSWTQNGNIWTSEAFAPSATPLILTINASLQRIARWPNDNNTSPGFGYIRASSVSGAGTGSTATFVVNNWSTLTGHPANTSSIYTNGGTIYTRINRYMGALKHITAASFSSDGTTATFTTDNAAAGDFNTSERGFFLENAKEFMDQEGEWVYDAVNKNVSVYFNSGNSPSGKIIEVPELGTVIDAGTSTYVTIDNLNVKGGNGSVVSMGTGSNVTVTNCTISFGRQNLSANASNSLVQNNTLNESTSYAITSTTSGKSNITFSDNLITNVNKYLGVGSGGNRSGCGIDLAGDNKNVIYNTFRNITYAAVNIGLGTPQLIAYNIIDSCGIRIDDGGPLYTDEKGSGSVYVPGYETGRVVKQNIIKNVVGDPNHGTFETTNSTNNLYLDQFTHHIRWDGNIIIGGTKSGTGFLANDPTYDTIVNNIFWNMSNRSYHIEAKHSDVTRTNYTKTIQGNIVKNNVFFYTQPVQQAEFVTNSVSPDVNKYGTFANNYFIAPYDRDGKFFQVDGSQYTLSGFQGSYTSLEKGSKLSPNPTNFVASSQPVGNYTKLIYNDHKKDSVIDLGNKVWYTADGDSLKGKVTLAPFTGEALVYKRDLGTNTDVTGPTVALTSPVNNATFTAGDDITLTATANDASGIDRVEFYYSGTLIGTATGSSPYSVVWNNVPATSYALTAVAYDNAGNLTKTGVTSITVNTAPKAPVVNITNPAANTTFSITDTVTINASASSPNTGGTITKVEFFQNNISLGSDISTPYTFSWKNPPAGTYTLKVVATDNLGQVSLPATVNITVTSSIANKAPTITMGALSSLYVAGSAINLTATAADADGTVKKVEFYSNTGILIGSDTTSPYSYTWIPAAGSYTVTAKATDNAGGSTMTSGTPVLIDAPPTVTLTSPVSGAVYTTTDSIHYAATTTDADGTVDSVQFYDGNTLIWTEKVTPWDVKRAPLSVGTHTITAVAYDNHKIKDTSAVATITVSSGAPITKRIALSADGNIHDRDDITAVAVEIGLIAKSNLQGSLVYFGYNDHWWSTTAAQQADETSSVLTNMRAWGGFDTTRFISVQNHHSQAVAMLTAEINKSTATDSLIICGLGPMQVIGEAIAASNAASRQYVRVVSHSTWNNEHAGNTGASEGLALPRYNLDATNSTGSGTTFISSMGVNITKIKDQNATVSAAYSSYYWMRDATDSRVRLMWDAGQLANKTNYDCSDAGVVWYILKNDQDGSPSKLQTFFSQGNNQAPTISLTSPAANATFTTPASISILANAADADGSVDRVEFYNGTTFLYTAPAAPYSYQWTGVTAGPYTITAKVYDNLGASVSTSVNITVNASVGPDLPQADKYYIKNKKFYKK